MKIILEKIKAFLNAGSEARSLSRIGLVVLVFVICVGANIAILPRTLTRSVDVETVQVSAMPLTVRAFGFIDAKASETLHAEFEAPVMAKKFKEGDIVRKGQVLVTLGRDKIKLDFQSKQDAYDNAQADLVHARKDLRLQRALYDKQAVAYSSVEDAKRTLVRADQAVTAAREAFRQAQALWHRDILTAPFDGTITKDGLQDDTAVAAGREIVTVSDVSEFSVVTRVDEFDSKRIAVQQPAMVRLPIYENRQFAAVVAQIGSAQQNNGLTEVPVTLKLTDAAGVALQPKLTAEVRIETGKTEAVLSVPLTALSNADGVSKVWVVDGLHRLRSRPVTLGRSNPDRTEIVQGLKGGDRVCVNPDPAFAEGMAVRLSSHASAS